MCVNKYLPFQQNILIELTCRAAMFCPAGKGLWGSWFSVPLAGSGYAVPVLDTLCFSSIVWLSSIRRTCPRYAVPVLNTLGLSYIRRTCPRYAVPVRDTLCLSEIR